jgi:class 3 adenylate cyclase
MKRVSIYILFAIAIMGSFIFFELAFDRLDWISFYREHFAENADRLEDQAVLTSALFTTSDSLDATTELLNSQTRLGGIDFWLLLYDGKLYATNIPEAERDHFRFSFGEPRSLHVVDRPEYSYVTMNLKEKFQLVVGLRYHEDLFFKSELQKREIIITRYIFGIVMLALLVFVFFFRDIMRALKNLQNKGKRNYVQQSVRSKEADMLTRGFSAYEDHAKQLRDERDLLSWQVLPALRTELMSGRTPPYDFNCTLVRTDINNFSKIYNEYPVEEFTATINDFFTDVTHIVSRYGGLVHEFIGDEVIFYFKDEDTGDSPAIALSAIRDINEVASKYNRLTLAERGYAFTVKSTLATGKIRFAKFVNGFNLAGSILIETVRILSHVIEKSGNVIIFDDRHFDAVKEIANTAHHGTAMLRGFSKEKVLLIYHGHKELKAVLDAAVPANLEKLKYYRSDADIAQALIWARSRSEAGDVTNALKVIGLMRLFAVTKTDGHAQATLAEWLEELSMDLASVAGKGASVDSEQAKVLAADRDGQLRVLASALRLIENLVPKKDFDLEFGARFDHILQRAKLIDDRRVVANALDVLSHFKSKKYPVISSDLLKHPDNRVAANAIVNEGIKEITPRVMRHLRKMLASRTPVHQASALYAMGELVGHYRLKDPVYLSTQLKFQDVLHKIPDYVTDEDPMVRRQALIAARKSAEPLIFARIWALVDSNPSNSAFAREVQEHMGMKLESRRDAA